VGGGIWRRIMDNEAHLYVTDKTGRKGWRTTCTFGYHEGERRNLERHIRGIQCRDPAYVGLGFDVETVRLVIEVDGSTPDTGPISDDDLLSQLMQ
jgi:hypothetical protein